MDKKTTIAWIIFVLMVAAGIWYYMNVKPVQPATPAGEMPAQTTASQDDLVGVWKYDDGTTYSTREFRADGTIEDRFDADRDGMIDASVSGTWKIMSAADLAAVTLPTVDATGTVVRVEFPEEAYYTLVNVSDDGQTLVFINYGQEGVYRYERM